MVANSCLEKKTYMMDRTTRDCSRHSVEKYKKKPYDRPNVIKNKEDKQHDNKEIMLPSHREFELARKLIIDTRFDCDYDKMNYFMPVLNPEKMRSTLQYIREVLSTGAKHYELYVPTTAELGLAFAIEGTSTMSPALIQM
jgi:hypothetical protein